MLLWLALFPYKVFGRIQRHCPFVHADGPLLAETADVFEYHVGIGNRMLEFWHEKIPCLSFLTHWTQNHSALWIVCLFGLVFVEGPVYVSSSFSCQTLLQKCLILQLLREVFKEACRTRVECCLPKDYRGHQLHDTLTLLFLWGCLK